jgi:hypothetical protein
MHTPPKSNRHDEVTALDCDRLSIGQKPRIADAPSEIVSGQRTTAALLWGRIMKSKQQHLATVVLAVMLCVAAVGRTDEPQVDPAADMLLKRMGAVIAAAEQFTVTNTFTSDEVVSTGEIVQLEGTVEISLPEFPPNKPGTKDPYGPPN